MTAKKTIAVLTALTGIGGLILGGFALKPAGAQASVPPGIGRPGGLGHGRRNQERHPELRKALRTLERTEADLRRADRDFGGHREKAADLCRQAEQQIQLALQDDTH